MNCKNDHDALINYDLCQKCVDFMDAKRQAQSELLEVLEGEAKEMPSHKPISRELVLSTISKHKGI